MKNISEKIDAYLQDPAYPFHMPGHKRREGQHDFTEIDGFDVLSHPEGVIAESQRRAAALFGADQTYYLVNGSTAGILAGVLAAADPAKMVLTGPDCHKSVCHAIELGGLKAVDADGTKIDAGANKRSAGKEEEAPTGEASCKGVLTSLADIRRELDWDALPARIERTLEKEGGAVGLVVVTSPTYEGVISDIGRIADIAHRHGALLLVDEAHGTHLGMHPAFGENSNRLGADLVVHSMHKTMTALTQTALLHVNEPKAGEQTTETCGLRERVEHFLEMLQTSSPSYLLMESMDRCVDRLTADKDGLFGDYADRLARLREKLAKLRYIGLFETEHFDPGKLVLTVKDNEAGYTAPMLYASLRDDYGLQLEFAQEEYALAMTSYADTEEAFGRLYAACAQIDTALGQGSLPKDGAKAAEETVHKTDCYQGKKM